MKQEILEIGRARARGEDVEQQIRVFFNKYPDAKVLLISVFAAFAMLDELLTEVDKLK